MDYFDDKAVTKKLMEEIEEYKRGERSGPSDYLGEQFLTLFNKFMTKHSYSGYSPDWKQDFLSKASYLFARHWYKFDPKRIQKNYRMQNGEKVLKDIDEFAGAHTFFTNFVATATHDIIRERKKEKEAHEKMISIEESSLKQEIFR